MLGTMRTEHYLKGLAEKTLGLLFLEVLQPFLGVFSKKYSF